MAASVASPLVPNVQFMPRATYEPVLAAEKDPFRHQSATNSHNHHDLHPWGPDVAVGSHKFDDLYARANNQYMYHLWYSPELAPFMATRVLGIRQLDGDLLRAIQPAIAVLIESGIEAALDSAPGRRLVAAVQDMLDSIADGRDAKPIFVRLGATSCKDSFAVNEPTTKPTPIRPRDADTVVRRMLTSSRVVGRLLTVCDGVCEDDPGEAVIIQEWSADIEMRREVRVFCYRGRVTAISQDAFYKKLGWREQYSNGFAQAVLDLWDRVRGFLPFDTCTMDLLMTPPGRSKTVGWTARIVEFNGFGAHLNTGSSLFHWVRDVDILEGRTPGLTIRFVDDWEEGDPAPVTQDNVIAVESEPPRAEADDGTAADNDEVPDWLELEKRLQENFSDKRKTEQRKALEGAAKLPLRGRWCSAF